MTPEWYRLEISGRIYRGYIVRIARNESGDFSVNAHTWTLFPNTVRSATTRIRVQAMRPLWEAIDRCRFWEMPRFDESRCGFDGTFYHVDAVVLDQSHRVVRWSPQGDPGLGEFVTLCDLLLDFGMTTAGLRWEDY
jgi:hypothetical protein